MKNGKVVDFTTTPSYTVDDATGTYAIRAANEMGGLSEATEANSETGIASLTPSLSKDEGTWYNLNGQPVNSSYKGIVIIRGKKTINR
jgi:hypothetical protein